MDANEWIGALKKIGITPLINDSATLSHSPANLAVSGVTDSVSKISPEIKASNFPEEKFRFKLLLSHRPDVAERASKAGFHLHLSGHTHERQFFPWTFILRFVHKFYTGLYQAQGMWVYVNCGSAAWGPPLRLSTSSKITLIRLHAKNRQSKENQA